VANRKTGRQAKSSSATARTGGLQQLEDVFQLMAKHGIVELEWDQAGIRVHARTGAAPLTHHSLESVMPLPSAASAAAPRPQVEVKPAAPAAASGKPASANSKQVLSPFVGTFYRSASPTAEPYVKEGKTVKRGDVLCIIEAMKLMNEIESEFTGKIASILVENGQPVEFGEPLFLIETT